MFEAQLLNFGSEVFSPWMLRGGDNIVVTLDFVDNSSKGQLKVQLYHKNTDEAGSGENVHMSTAIEASAAGRTSKEWNGLKELVRYRFEVTSLSSGDWVLFRMLSPVWFDDVKA